MDGSSRGADPAFQCSLTAPDHSRRGLSPVHAVAPWQHPGAAAASPGEGFPPAARHAEEAFRSAKHDRDDQAGLIPGARETVTGGRHAPGTSTAGSPNLGPGDAGGVAPGGGKGVDEAAATGALGGGAQFAGDAHGDGDPLPTAPAGCAQRGGCPGAVAVVSETSGGAPSYSSSQRGPGEALGEEELPPSETDGTLPGERVDLSSSDATGQAASDAGAVDHAAPALATAGSGDAALRGEARSPRALPSEGPSSVPGERPIAPPRAESQQDQLPSTAGFPDEFEAKLARGVYTDVLGAIAELFVARGESAERPVESRPVSDAAPAEGNLPVGPVATRQGAEGHLHAPGDERASPVRGVGAMARVDAVQPATATSFEGQGARPGAQLLSSGGGVHLSPSPSRQEGANSPGSDPGELGSVSVRVC